MLEAFQRYWHGDQEEIQLLLDWRDPDEGWRRRWSAAGSITLHLLLAVGAVWMPADPARQSPEAPRVVADLRRATPLVAPRIQDLQLTQREAQTGKPAAEVDLASLMPRPEVRSAPARPRPGGPPPGAPVFQPPPQSAKQETRLVEAPGLDLPLGTLPPSAPVPRIREAEPPPPQPPKLAFEKLGTPSPGSTKQPGTPTLQPPRANVDEAVRQVARAGAGRGLMVGDIGAGAGGYSDPLNLQGRPLQNLGTLELLSDPQGVDFRPYMIQVLAAVKRNWMAVIPESARLGRQGRVAVQFSIHTSGRVPKLVIASPSGTDALDRAAVAGISASNPFPPLPPEFKGTEIRLQLVFSYNMPR